MQENTRKSFYIFLSMFLGVVLFLMLQRTAFLIAFLAGADITALPVMALEYVTSVVALVFGAWYGIWLGLVWYSAVYEERTTRGFVGWLTGMGKQGRAAATPDGAWEFDDLVAVSSEDARGKEQLEYFEANTVKFAGSSPVAASRIHISPATGVVKAKAPAKRAPRKTVARKKAVNVE